MHELLQGGAVLSLLLDKLHIACYNNMEILSRYLKAVIV